MDKGTSRKVGLSQFLKLWPILEEKIQEQIAFEGSQIDLILSQRVPPEKLDLLNEKVLKRETYKRIFMMVDELREEAGIKEEKEGDE